MQPTFDSIEPKLVWKHFLEINAIPRASKKEEKIIAHMVDFGKKLGLKTQVDEIQNVLIKKPATKGMEACKTVVLQSHLDMVHQKNANTIFDFDTEGISMRIENGWILAQGTTLGADNGIGVATIMAVLLSKDIPHPAIEAFFTIDEETGMTGAMHLKPGFLSGSILLNLDTEDDDEITIGCAGGIDITARQKYTEIKPSENEKAFQITVSGLQGGHSGMDIHKGFGNANKIMNRILWDLSVQNLIQIASIEGGSLRNAIPRESKSIVLIKNSMDFNKTISNSIAEIKKELEVTEPHLTISLTETELPTTVLDKQTQQKLLKSIYAVQNGVYSMNPSIQNLVETSNNLARVRVKNGEIEIACLTRSFSETGKNDLANALQSVFELGGFNVHFSGNYPGWEPKPTSELLKIAIKTYEKLNLDSPKVQACHAGLECGLLGTHYPDMEMISFGPTIKGAHSPEERVNIESTEKFWHYLLELLKNTPRC